MDIIKNNFSSISFVVPCYNEEDNISDVINEIESAINFFSNIVYEIIIIDDASNDNTLKIIKEMQKMNKNIKIIQNKENQGLGGSIKKGFYNIQNDYVMYLPGDNCHSKTEIKKLLEVNSDFDILLSYYSNTRIRNLFRRLFTYLYTPFLNLIFGLNLPYYNGIAIYKKKVLDSFEIKTSSYTWQIELLVKMLKNNQTKLELVSTVLSNRNKGASKAFNIKNCFKVIYSIAVIFLWNIKN